MGDYAAFSFAKRVADNCPGELHKLGISYDKASNTVRWEVDGREVQRVSRVGLPIDRSNMVLDRGGTPTEVSLNQLNCGMGLFTLLDANTLHRGGLAKLSTAPGFYFNPAQGQPTPETFVDQNSVDGSRLFGQGAGSRSRSTTSPTSRVCSRTLWQTEDSFLRGVCVGSTPARISYKAAKSGRSSCYGGTQSFLG